MEPLEAAALRDRSCPTHVRLRVGRTLCAGIIARLGARARQVRALWTGRDGAARLAQRPESNLIRDGRGVEVAEHARAVRALGGARGGGRIRRAGPRGGARLCLVVVRDRRAPVGRWALG